MQLLCVPEAISRSIMHDEPAIPNRALPETYTWLTMCGPPLQAWARRLAYWFKPFGIRALALLTQFHSKRKNDTFRQHRSFAYEHFGSNFRFRPISFSLLINPVQSFLLPIQSTFAHSHPHKFHRRFQLSTKQPTVHIHRENTPLRCLWLDQHANFIRSNKHLQIDTSHELLAK